MTDSIIQFKYSDDVHMVGIYIKSDTHQHTFIPLLYDIVKSCEYTNRNRSWSYVVAEIVTKITNKYESLVSFVLESQFDLRMVIHKYSITITENMYETTENKLLDFCKIKYIDKEQSFDGLLKDFYEKIIKENNRYRITELEEEIKEKQEELKELLK